MSYLDVPRIHFAGQFFTDPSTVNNDPQHYEPACTTPSPWQDPNGQHRFQLRNCTINSVVGPNGFVDDDTLVGGIVSTTDKPDIARIVDLDVYQQGVPTLFGIQLRLTSNDGQSITGNADPAVVNGLWFQSVLPTRSWESGDYGQGSYGGDMNACGLFQTVIRFDAKSWPDTSSKILRQLRAATLTVNGQLLLSVKFVVDGYQNVPQDTNYRLGRIVGTIGPVKVGEPLYNPGQRWLRARPFSPNDPWNSPSFNDAPFKVDMTRWTLVLDLANSLCRQSAGGPPVDLGTVTVSVSTPLSPVATTIGQVDYSAFAYDNNAHVTELNLTDAQIRLLAKGTLSLTMSRTDIGPPAVLTEAAADLVYAVEVRPVRLAGDPGTTATTRVYASRKGVPVVNKQLAVWIESVHGTTPGATVPPTNPGNTPQGDGAIKAVITPTDSTGFATLTITVLKNPGQRTPELDGQLYFVIVYDPAVPHSDWSKEAPQQDHLISCLVWSQYAVNSTPQWPQIQAMMAPYMKLYPSMKAQVDLADLHTFTIFSKNPPWDKVYNETQPGPLGIKAGAIPFYLSRDYTDPRFMPISRDLSPGKIMTVMHFIKNMQDEKITHTA